MTTIGILHQPRIPESEPMAAEIHAWLTAQGIEAWAGSTWDEEQVNGNMARFSLLVVLGGDGSTLRAARLSVPHDVPIFGINMGRVGFLSEAQLDNWQEKLDKVLRGEYWLEQRLMLQARLERNGRIINTLPALNDVVVSRGRQARVLRLHLFVDGDHVTLYTADALIVATPTGSTAYSMAAGGPLLPPQLQNFVVVPVAAHLSLDRALVLHEEAEITIQVQMDHEAALMADGQDGISLQDGDKVIVKKHDHYCSFVRVESPGYFYRRLMRRLGHARH
ncbi:MAG: NAD(+)/NADH kinase [Ardenticatenaceae bacterium]|nr:NAD(+)/NADH kinase [Ardenticatenaceae bacterium]MCB8991593.1 NAD(+)/NADH kinase [Ardenticatenaceae bacterium]MCB9004222.1 NAD(+)/NADH kinase [Ardenticatenaceae bacterium]